jgi:hypothetical protein
MEQLQRPATTPSRRVGRRRCSFLSMEPVAGLRRVERTQAEGPIQIRGQGSICKYVDPDKDLLVNTESSKFKGIEDIDSKTIKNRSVLKKLENRSGPVLLAYRKSIGSISKF